MRRTALSIVVIMGSIGWTAGCHRKPGEQQKVALHLPAGTPKRPQGMTALTVPFTKNDVVNYFKTHNLPMNSGAVSDFRVDTLEFLTNQQVTARLHGASPGLADNDRLGFVTLTGTFVFTGPPKGKPVRFSRAYSVFDVSTGNLLMTGTLDEQGEQPR